MGNIDETNGSTLSKQIKERHEEYLKIPNDILLKTEAIYEGYLKRRKYYLLLTISFCILGVAVSFILLYKVDISSLLTTKVIFSFPFYYLSHLFFNLHKNLEPECEKYYKEFMYKSEQYAKADIIYKHKHNPSAALMILLTMYPESDLTGLKQMIDAMSKHQIPDTFKQKIDELVN